MMSVSDSTAANALLQKLGFLEITALAVKVYYRHSILKKNSLVCVYI